MQKKRNRFNIPYNFRRKRFVFYFNQQNIFCFHTFPLGGSLLLHVSLQILYTLCNSLALFMLHHHSCMHVSRSFVFFFFRV